MEWEGAVLGILWSWVKNQAGYIVEDTVVTGRIQSMMTTWTSWITSLSGRLRKP